ncbi:hypothetical protein L226DRAFT_85695 [Lentinus tigrinus ALCF2SS1-7]|uniref:uncharacterized protein n=1 Tax=Lentinus tigrinus ALCF2SS1-7 TaxID=1328758 RepID=UPI001165CEC9|nr:hypothetical protein L226DRAFT_85695 [Lentinus tigrinus ALCF2SS1-7]
MNLRDCLRPLPIKTHALHVLPPLQSLSRRPEKPPQITTHLQPGRLSRRLSNCFLARIRDHQSVLLVNAGDGHKYKCSRPVRAITLLCGNWSRFVRMSRCARLWPCPSSLVFTRLSYPCPCPPRVRLTKLNRTRGPRVRQFHCTYNNSCSLRAHYRPHVCGAIVLSAPVMKISQGTGRRA